MPILTENEWLGQTVAERYRLDEILSVGGMGVLFRASDVATGERVAVKMLKPAFALDQQRVARFLRETRIAAVLQSEHVAKVRAIWQDAADVPFLIMELLEGRSLEEELESRGVLTLEETLAIAIPVANALQAAHRAGIVHRDVKPANIFLCTSASGERVVKLLDFGIAKNDEDDFETQTGAVLGTPSYMAPEQAQHGDSGPYTDVWGFGAVVYRCLAGRPPHSGESSREVLGKVLREPVAPLVVPGVSRLVCAVVDRALAREPHHRYSDVEALMQALITAKSRAQAATAEMTTAENPAIQTLLTDLEAERELETLLPDLETERELEGATRTAASSVPGRSRSLRSAGFMFLGAALATWLLASSPAPLSRGVLSETKREHELINPRHEVAAARVSLVPSLATSDRAIPPVASSAARSVSTKSGRAKPIRPPTRDAPARGVAAETAMPARVEQDPKSGLAVVTEW